MKCRPVSLVAMPLLLVGAAAWSQPTCQLDEVQRLMGEATPPHARIAVLLADCARARPHDWQVPWLQGVNARNQRQLTDAAQLLGRARAMAPAEAAPSLDLAVVHEWRGESREAGALYAEVLARDPQSRPALLGAARVARAMGRTAEARRHYEDVLRRHPDDAAALAGLGFLDLEDLRLEAARGRFEAVLRADPGNADAREGLAQLDSTWRYQLDATLGSRRLAAGGADSAAVDLRIGLDARSDIELGLLRHTRELPSASLVDPTPLPSWAARLGYRTRTGGDVVWSVAYERRERRADPTEHRVELGAGGRLQGPWVWSIFHREGFGASVVRNRLTQAGLSLDVARHWSVAGTLYVGDSRLGGSSKAALLELRHDPGPSAVAFNIGIGHSPDPDNTSVNARVVVPLARQHALVLAVERRSLGSEWEATVGWRHFWR